MIRCVLKWLYLSAIVCVLPVVNIAYAATVTYDAGGVAVVDGVRTLVYGTFRDPGDDWQDFTAVQQAGFNCTSDAYFAQALVAGYGSADVTQLATDAQMYLDLAAGAGVGVALPLPRQAVIDNDASAIGAFVSAVQNKSALWFYILFENPYDASLPAGNLQSVYNHITSLDSSHPVVVVETADNLSDDPAMGTYCNSIWVNSRMIPFGQLALGRAVEQVRTQYPGKVVWSVPQCVDALVYEDRTGMTPATLLMTDARSAVGPAQIRGQVHGSLAAGSGASVMQYPPQTQHDIVEHTPAVWQAIVDVGGELAELAPALLSTDPVPSFTLYDRVWGRTLRMRDLYGDAEADPPVGYPNNYVRWWSRWYDGSLYVGLVADYMPLNRMRLQLPFEFTRVVQYPGEQTVIIAGVDGADPYVDFESIPVAIWNVQNNNEIEFVMNTCDTVVWRFDQSAGSQVVVYAEDFTGGDGTLPSGWSMAVGSASIVNNELHTDSSSGSTVRGMYAGAGSSSWQDYTVECDISQTFAFPTGTTSSTLYSAVTFRVQDGDHYYMARIRKLSTSTTPVLEVVRYDTGAISTVGSSVIAEFDANTWYRLTVTANGENLSAELKTSGGVSLGTASGTDATYAIGSVGIHAIMSGSYSSMYDNLTVEGSSVP